MRSVIHILCAPRHGARFAVNILRLVFRIIRAREAFADGYYYLNPMWAIQTGMELSLPRRQNSRSIQLLIITRKPQVRQTLFDVFSGNRAVNLVGVFENVTDITFSSGQPNMILLNLDACSNDVRETLKHCRSSCPQARICILAPDLDEGTLQRCFDVKADGYMVEDTSPMQLVGALKVVAMGAFYCDARLSARKLSANNASRLSSLSPEGLRIVHLIARGYSPYEIHLEIGIPEDDVRDSIRHIYAQFGIPKRVSTSVETIATGSN